MALFGRPGATGVGVTVKVLSFGEISSTEGPAELPGRTGEVTVAVRIVRVVGATLLVEPEGEYSLDGAPPARG